MTRPSGPLKQEPAQSFSLPRGAVVEEVRIRSPENKEDRRHRLRKEFLSFWIKEASVYIVALLILLAAAAYCFWVLFQPSLPREDRQWAMSLLGGLIGGIVGYLFGRATK